MANENTIVPAVLANTGLLGKLANDNVSEWMRLELMKPQFHEAGHAVVARYLNFPVEWASVDAAFISQNPTAIQNGCSDALAVCMTISSGRIEPILNPPKGAKHIRTKSDRETVVSYVMHALAGPYTEMGMDPASFDRGGAERDMAKIEAVLQLVEPDRGARKKLFAEARRKLDRLLDECWPAIQRVALALHERKTIYGYEIDALIRDEELGKPRIRVPALSRPLAA